MVDYIICDACKPHKYCLDGGACGFRAQKEAAKADTIERLSARVKELESQRSAIVDELGRFLTRNNELEAENKALLSGQPTEVNGDKWQHQWAEGLRESGLLSASAQEQSVDERKV